MLTLSELKIVESNVLYHLSTVTRDWTIDG